MKRKIASTATQDVINLATSGVATAFANQWQKDVIAQRGSEIVERLSEPNQFGLLSLKQAIRAAYHLPTQREIVITPGALGGIRLISELLLAGRRGAEVIVESPVYEPLRAIPERLGAKIVLVERRDFSAIARSVSDDTVAVFLSNLHNPTGHWLNHEELSKIAHDLEAIGSRALVVIDETFSDAGPQPGTTAAVVDARIVTISSLSKSHGLPGLRCGWITADPTVLPGFVEEAVLFQNIGCKFAEIIGAMAIEEIDAFRRAARDNLDRNRALVSEWMKEMAEAARIEPQHTPPGCVVFPRLLNCRSTAALSEQLEAQYGVLVALGRFFGDAFDDRVRIGFGGDHDDLKRGLSRLADGLIALCRNSP